MIRPSDPPAPAAWRPLGRLPFADAHRLMRDLVDRRAGDLIPDQVLLCEHDPVITAGPGTRPGDIGPDPGVPVVSVERGGRATYHGPGQILLYWIRRLEPPERDLHDHLRRLEGWAIAALAVLGVAAESRPGLTGVWVAGRKIASIGIAVRRWVTWHGLALNVAGASDAFTALRPCGLHPSVMTSLDLVLGRPLSPAAAEDALRRAAPMPLLEPALP